MFSIDIKRRPWQRPELPARTRPAHPGGGDHQFCIAPCSLGFVIIAVSEQFDSLDHGGG